MRFKNILLLAVAGMGALALSTPVSAVTFGVNVNEGFQAYQDGKANALGANWVRGFVEMNRFLGRWNSLKNGPTPVKKLADAMRADAQIGALLAIPANKRLIVNLKYNFSASNFPTGADYDDIERVTQAFLDVVWTRASIIVTGNEPFIESINSDAQRGAALTNFYAAITNYVIKVRSARTIKPLIYVGAFNNLHQTGSAFRRYSAGLLNYANRTAGVDGVDVHGHVPGWEGLDQAIAFAAQASGKNVIVTEFSLIQYWNQQVDKPIETNAAFKLNAAETGAGLNTARQYINYAMSKQGTSGAISLERWNNFLKAQSWYGARASFLDKAKDVMAARGVSRATYALINTQSSLPGSADPWVLNAPFCTSICPANSTQQQWPWFGEFKALPH
jgi:hypothetical protein